MTRTIKKISVALMSLLFFIVVGVTSVQAQPPPGGVSPTGPGGTSPTSPSGISIKLENPFKGGNSLFVLLKTVVNDIILPIGGVIAVLSFIYSGFLYVIARGNEEKLKKAHRALLYTSIGTAVLLGAWVLANAICRTIGQLGGPVCPI